MGVEIADVLLSLHCFVLSACLVLLLPRCGGGGECGVVACLFMFAQRFDALCSSKIFCFNHLFSLFVCATLLHVIVLNVIKSSGSFITYSICAVHRKSKPSTI